MHDVVGFVNEHFCLHRIVVFKPVLRYLNVDFSLLIFGERTRAIIEIDFLKEFCCCVVLFFSCVGFGDFFADLGFLKLSHKMITSASYATIFGAIWARAYSPKSIVASFESLLKFLEMKAMTGLDTLASTFART